MLSVDPRRLSVNLTGTSGQVYRWGDDESRPENVPVGLTITTQMPGGFGSASVTLPRRADTQYADLAEFSPVTVSGGGGNFVAFDGYLSAYPFTRDTSYSFTPQCIGWSAQLKDDNSFTMVYIDRRLSQWQGPSTQRQLSLATSNYNLQQFGFQTGMTGDPSSSGDPAIIVRAQGALVGYNPISEVWYDAGAGNQIAMVRCNIQQLGGRYANADTNVNVNAYLADSSIATHFKGSSNYWAGAGNPGWVSLTTDNAYNYRFAMLQHYYTLAAAATAGAAGTTYGMAFSGVSVIGNHGLTIQNGPGGTQSDDGFFGGDIIADIVSRTCPSLTVQRGPGGVASDSFVIPQAVFLTPTTGDAAVQSINQYYLNDYGVYENRSFFWQAAGSGRQWRVRLGEGVRLTDNGPQIETAYNGVVVSYTDGAGATKYVGPPGFNGDATSTLLQDTSSSNPCNAFGRKRWGMVQIGLATQSVAIQVGVAFLGATRGRPTAGTLTVTGSAYDSGGREWPVWMIRAGDTVSVVDAADPSPRYILGTSYSHDSLVNTLTLDAAPNKLDWLLARLSLAVSPLG